MMKQFEKEDSTRLAAGEKEGRFLHHSKIMESIRNTGNTNDVFKDADIR